MFTAALIITPAIQSAAQQQPKDSVARDVVQVAPADEQGLSEKQLLGKRIFEDRRLSEPEGVACASCHEAKKAFQGDNNSHVQGVASSSRPGVFGDRNVPSLMYAAFVPPFGYIEQKDRKTGEIKIVPAGGLFWDGRAADLQQQVEGPLLNKREMNNPSKAVVVEKIRKGPYADLARKVAGPALDTDDAAFAALAAAVVEFEKTPRFSPFNSKFDAFLQGRETLSPLEQKGFALFKDPEKGNCIACHDGKPESRNPRDWMFTDFTYDILGAPRNRRISDTKVAGYFDPGLCKRPDLLKGAPDDFKPESVCGAFRVPTLRNIAVTSPYMHNGVFAKLRDAVAFYFTRDTNPGRWYARDRKGRTIKFDDLPESWRENANVEEIPYDRKPGEKPRATEAEIDALVAFLQTLTDRPTAP